MRAVATAAATVAVVFVMLPLFVLGLSWTVGTVSGETLGIVLRTAAAALVATAVSMGLGATVGYRLSRHPMPGRNWVRLLLRIPDHIPQAAVGLALVLAYGGTVHGGPPWPGEGAVIAAMVFVSLPVAVEEARRGFDGVDTYVERASRTLGAGAIKTFWRVTLPLAADSLLGGVAVVFGRSFGEFAVLAFFAPQPATVGTAIYRWFFGGMAAEATVLAVMATALSLLCWGMVSGIRLWVGRRLGRFRV
ncbi:MAG: ABC transporter permease subunit [Kyrpidia sp.]|nr:ABC transporter permease subunit [Kyrpidia sp.]